MRSNLNPTGGTQNLATEPRIRRRGRTFSSTQDEEIRKRGILRHQNTVKRRERLKELSKSDPDYANSLDIKECMLEVQGMLVGKLAAEENHFKGLAVLPGVCIIDFEERVKEVEEVIQALQY
jgi:hypothetical protein